MPTLRIEIPARSRSAMVALHLEEASLRTPERDYTGIKASLEAARALREIGYDARVGEAISEIEVSCPALAPLARACREHAAATYPDAPSIPVLIAIADAAEAA